ncbi:DUF1064 domain-containing protein [Gracilibacillus oryzae]|uniref:DUF1064 domain-containing protein n=1 Tax=Gracilibacillus oryzae TaxID=1672701 RepID=A0A7C8L6D3_9BACI|nr:DUF1064 domain-containing protein [Gracilibacillus oryzae]KAB8139283.1 DUF1064 domain-containing protein [Gracilibacillus oryzae]
MILRQQKKRRTKSKYGNRKTKVDGHTFDSKLEAKYYGELLLRKKAGEIKSFKLQPRYELQPTYKKDNKTVRKIEYVADFLIEYADGSIEVVDIKGHITKEFALKRKIFEFQHDLKLSVLAWDKWKGWYEV